MSRRNLAQSPPEMWRPPLFAPSGGTIQRAAAALRRFFDIQAASLWRDLRHELSGVSGVLVDVGCGAQPYRPLVPAGVRYVGLDTADARERFGYDVPDTMYFTGDRWPVGDGEADVVLAAEVLEHVGDPALFLAEASRVLKPGGTLVVTVPFAARWHFIPFDYRRYTPSELDILLSAACFVDRRIHARGTPLTVACYKMMALLLPLAFPQSRSAFSRLAMRAAGLLTSPLLVLLAAVANLSLGGDWGDDCLGYTAVARKEASRRCDS